MKTLHKNPQSAPDQDVDQRPRFGIGHVSITAADVAAMTDFYTAVGMRLVVNMGRASILELRGGTHLVIQAGVIQAGVIQAGEAGNASLDLIVDDIDETHAVLDANGGAPGPIQRGNPHDRFIATDPEGNTLIINSNHAIGVV